MTEAAENHRTCCRLGGTRLGNVRTDQIKRTARELVRRFPDRFSGNFDENKKLVGQLLQGPSRKIRNQVAGYIVRYLSGVEEEIPDEEPQEEGEKQ
jgi:small subunit ribosomal protein S17e